MAVGADPSLQLSADTVAQILRAGVVDAVRSPHPALQLWSAVIRDPWPPSVWEASAPNQLFLDPLQAHLLTTRFLADLNTAVTQLNQPGAAAPASPLPKSEATPNCGGGGLQSLVLDISAQVETTDAGPAVPVAVTASAV